ncbi:MAG: SACE_7040 family transcriptional regulator [Nocardioidaceae bacterium]
MAASRREQILSTAAAMFAERGFHGVSIAELGAACGVSGPALYRHFPRKDAMLADMLVGISEELLTEGRRRSAAATSAEDALTALVRWHIEFALDHRDLIVVQDRDWSALAVEAREQVRTLQLGYVEVWVEVLVAVNSDWDRRTARAAAHAVFGLLNSTPHSARLSRGAMAELLEELALAAVTTRRAPAVG